MANRCPNCGNEMPNWAHGHCYVCRRNETDERRDSQIALRRRHRGPRIPSDLPLGASGATYDDRPSPRPLTASGGGWELSTGIWMNDERSIILNFPEGAYQSLNSTHRRNLSLVLINDNGPDIHLKIGAHQVRVWVDVSGDLTLHRRTMMRFRCRVGSKLYKLCLKCRRLCPVRRRNCPSCGRGWSR